MSCSRCCYIRDNHLFYLRQKQLPKTLHWEESLFGRKISLGSVVKIVMRYFLRLQEYKNQITDGRKRASCYFAM